MPAKVFISCGQRIGPEREAAQNIKEWFDSQGYVGYVATEVQTLPELNQNIIQELKTSDYYLFLNFKRERLLARRFPRRGSVYTQQELAVAYSLGFNDMLVLNQIGTKKEGIHEFMVSNSEEFHSPADVLQKVQDAVGRHTWNKNHSRHLQAQSVRINSTPIVFGDHVGTRFTWIVSGVIRNARPDISASHCTGRCVSINPGGVSPNQGFLKVCGHIGHQQLIWPCDTADFDLLNILADDPRFPGQPPYPTALIPSDLDFRPPPFLFPARTRYVLAYEAYAENFPRLVFQIEVDVTGTVPSVRLL